MVRREVVDGKVKEIVKIFKKAIKAERDRIVVSSVFEGKKMTEEETAQLIYILKLGKNKIKSVWITENEIDDERCYIWVSRKKNDK